MKRTSAVLFSLTMLLATSVVMTGQAYAEVIADACVVEGAGTLHDGVRFSGNVRPDENAVVGGTWEHWTACVSTATCNDFTGALQGLCNAYCEAMNCTGDFPEASEVACERVRGNFFKKGGLRLPCEPCGDHFVGTAERMFCWRNGVVLADIWGTGSLNGETGYEFQVHAQDFNAGVPNLYQIFIWAPDGSVASAAADVLSSGNITVTP